MLRPVRALLLLTVIALVLAPSARPASHPRCFGAAARDAAHPCVNHRLDRTVTPRPDAALIQPGEPCTVSRRRKPPVCEFGAEGVEPTVALAGDSHSRHWAPALAPTGRRDGWRAALLYRSQCPLSLARKRTRSCLGWVRQSVAYLREHPAIDTLYVSAMSTASVDAPREQRDEARIQGFLALWQELPDSIRTVYVLRDVPHASAQTHPCVRRALRRHRVPGARCARDYDDALPLDPEAEAARRDTGGRVHLIDLTPFMCSTERCFPVVGGVLVTKDTGHLTRTFARTLGPYLERAVGRLEG